LGRVSIAITLDVYGHGSPEMGQEAADQMQELVSPQAVEDTVNT
jgi:hypothetical protein